MCGSSFLFSIPQLPLTSLIFSFPLHENKVFLLNGLINSLKAQDLTEYRGNWQRQY